MKTIKTLRQAAGVALIFGVAGCSSVKNGETVTDIDGNVYRTVRIGDQVWMKDNLRTTRYNDGTPIANITDPTEWRHTDQPAYAWSGNDISNKEIYGALYNGHVAGHPNLCPPGWRVPTDEDFKKLERYVGMTPEEIESTGWRGTNPSGGLKQTGTDLWDDPNTGATNETGFSAIPAGRRWCSGEFQRPGIGSTLWTSTEHSISGAVYRHMGAKNARIGRNPNGDKKYGYAIRLIRDD